MFHMSGELKFKHWLSIEEGRYLLNLLEIPTGFSNGLMFEEPTARH